jgi:hypothetical protein
MTMPCLARLAACALIVLGMAQPALARGEQAGDFSLNAVVGGALPYSTSAGYVVTRLITSDRDGHSIDFTRSQPFGGQVKEVFDSRPQIGLGGRYELGRSGGAKLALKAMVSAGTERPEGARPMVGLAGISLVF